MRHELKFPEHNDYDACCYLVEAWKRGWLDEYSDDHFLIKAIENRLTTFSGYTQMLNNEPIGISPDISKKITAVIVYTEALEGLMFSDFRYVWQKNGQGQRFRMWILDQKLRNAEVTRESDIS